MSINEKSYAYGASKSSIREIAAYGAARKAEIGAENVYDFSLGNPSIPAPDAVRASLARNIELDPVQLHSYTPAVGLPVARLLREIDKLGGTDHLTELLKEAHA